MLSVRWDDKPRSYVMMLYTEHVKEPGDCLEFGKFLYLTLSPINVTLLWGQRWYGQPVPTTNNPVSTTTVLRLNLNLGRRIFVMLLYPWFTLLCHMCAEFSWNITQKYNHVFSLCLIFSFLNKIIIPSIASCIKI